jgi:hypothetical protein
VYGGLNFLGQGYLAYHALRWQPYINVAADTQSHAALESNADRFPLLLLNPPIVGNPLDDGTWLQLVVVPRQTRLPILGVVDDDIFQPPPPFRDDEGWVLPTGRRDHRPVTLVHVDPDFVAPKALDDSFWLAIVTVKRDPRIELVTANDEVGPKLDEQYWHELLAPRTRRPSELVSADEEIVPQPIVFVPVEEYGPRFLSIEVPFFGMAYGSDSAGYAPTFFPEEDYAQQVVGMGEVRWGQSWGGDGASFGAAPPPVGGFDPWHRHYRRMSRR